MTPDPVPAPQSADPDRSLVEDVLFQLDRYDLREAEWLLAREIVRIQVALQGRAWAARVAQVEPEDLPHRQLYDGGDVGDDALGRLCRAHWLALVGRRVMDLNGEDLDEVDAWRDVPPSVQRLLASATWPGRPDSHRRGSLGNLRPMLRLVLEVIGLRLERDETTDVLALVHLLSDYLPLLAWQTELGNAGEPRTLARRLEASRSTWEDPAHPCPQRPSVQGAAQRVGRAGDTTGVWRRYLHQTHTRAADVLHTCGRVDDSLPRTRQGCAAPCEMAVADPGRRHDLARRLDLVQGFRESALVQARHRTPAGHFFAVPEVAELQASWTATKKVLQRRVLGQPFAALLRDQSGALPGLGGLVAAVACDPKPLVASSVVDVLVDRMRDLLAPLV